MNLNAIELRLLRGLIELSRSPSFVRAAEKLRISQPALSQQMAELSAALGVPLFEKVGRRSVLTEAGRSFANAVSQSLGRLDDTLLEHSLAKDKISGVLRIAATNTYLRALAMPVASRISKEHPGLKLNLREMPAHDILRALEEGSVDLGISPRMDARKTLLIEPLLTEQFGVIGPRNMIRDLGKTTKLAALASKPLVLVNQDFLMRQQIDRQAKLDNVQLNIRMEVSGAQNIIAALRLGGWLSICTSLSIDQEPTLGFVPLKGKYLSRAAVIYQRSATPSTRAIELFKSEMLNHRNKKLSK